MSPTLAVLDLATKESGTQNTYKPRDHRYVLSNFHGPTMSLQLGLIGIDSNILLRIAAGQVRLKLREGTPPRIEFFGPTPFHVVEGVDSTPRFPRFGSNGGCFKSPAWKDKAVEEMDACYVEQDWDDFMKDNFADTRPIPDGQARKVTELRELTSQKRSNEEWLLYPPTVRSVRLLCRRPNMLIASTVQNWQ